MRPGRIPRAGLSESADMYCISSRRLLHAGGWALLAATGTIPAERWAGARAPALNRAGKTHPWVPWFAAQRSGGSTVSNAFAPAASVALSPGEGAVGIRCEAYSAA